MVQRSCFPNNHELPATVIPLELDRNADAGTFKGEMTFLDFDGTPLSAEQTKARFPNAVVGKVLDGSYRFKEEGFEAEVRSDIGVELAIGTFDPERQKDEWSNIEPDPGVQSWSDFQERVRPLFPRRYLFRGQGKPWRLRTSFHRTRRKDLVRYWREDMPALEQNLSHLLNGSFDLTNDKHVGAFFSLVQHHGYPTPLLDWSYSAHVAAFFAFQKADESSEKPVRVWAFDINAWEKDFPPEFNMANSGPHITRVETLAIENPRQAAQQGVGTLTSVSDMEFFLQNRQTDNDRKYIHAFDLPASERQQALSELAMMGVTAASLFPGLDGTCEALRGRFFGDLNKVPQATL